MNVIVMVSNATGIEVGLLAGKYPGALGHLFSPKGERGPWAELPYALDNGAYGAFLNSREWSEAEWRRLISWAAMSGQHPLWCVVPDVVQNREATLALWPRFAPVVRSHGFRPAFAAQDGMTFDDVPDSECVIFDDMQLQLVDVLRADVALYQRLADERAVSIDKLRKHHGEILAGFTMLSELANVAVRKLTLLVRDYPGDKEAKALISSIVEMLKTRTDIP